MCSDTERESFTPGEKEFCSYLSEQSVEHSRWKGDQSRKNPDFVIQFNEFNVLAEVKDICDGEDEKLVIREAERGIVQARRFDPSRRSRQRIFKSIDQLAIADNGQPTVCVLFGAAILPYEDDSFLRGALYGELKMIFDLSSETRPYSARYDSQELVNSRNASSFRRSDTRHISAVAVIEQIQHRKHLQNRLQDKMIGDCTDAKQFLEELEEWQRWADATYGIGYFSERTRRVRVYHNPNAMAPLPEGIFDESKDWHLKVIDGRFTEYGFSFDPNYRLGKSRREGA